MTGMHEVLARPIFKQATHDQQLSRWEIKENRRLEIEFRKGVETKIAEVRATGVYGAQLVLHAGREARLRSLMLHERPLLRAGMTWPQIVRLAGINLSGGMDGDDDASDR